MKVTIVHTNNKKQLLVSTKTMEKLLQRIAKDDSRLTVTHFREYVTYMESGYEYYKDMPTWMHIYPAAEFAKDENNNLKMAFTSFSFTILRMASISVISR